MAATRNLTPNLFEPTVGKGPAKPLKRPRKKLAKRRVVQPGGRGKKMKGGCA